jgi:AcrR family transcriptional regulator
MRRLGRKLDVEGMALYTYVDNKDDLLDAVAERVLSELELPELPAGDWKGRIRALVHGWAELQLGHPNAFPLIYRARRWASEDFEILEETFDALAAAGLDPKEAALAYSSMIGALDGMLFAGYLTTYDARGVWQRGRAAADPKRFPHYRAAAAEAAKLRGADIFEHALDLLLRGLER